MKKKILLAVATASIALLSGQAFAGEVGKFDKMDTNKDGMVTKAEYLDMKTQWFNKMDSNSDGSISKAEADTFHKAMKDKYQNHSHNKSMNKMAPQS